MNRITKLLSEKFMHGMTMNVSLADGRNITLTPDFAEAETVAEWTYAGDGINAKVTAETSDTAAVFHIDLTSEAELADNAVTFAADPSFADNTVDYHMDSRWWAIYNFPATSEEICNHTYGFIFEKDSSYIGMTTLLDDIFYTHVNNEGLHLDIRCEGYSRLCGYFMIAAENDDAIAAVKDSFEFGRETGAVNVPLRYERDYPEMFEGFGWCSWNAFYQDVTADKLYSKLDEFKEKNIPVKWIIIDDGWSLINDGKLASLDADPAKFPDGLGGCIKRIKEEYGIEKVGVWHTINGYWQGLDPNSEMAKEYADYLMTLKNGMVIPSVDPDKGFVFWDAFHSHLAECGVDFVKVDNQSSTFDYLNRSAPIGTATIGIHEGIEQSVAKNFGGNIINCMGMDMQNVLSRPFTAISRNSDDFYPHRENGFSKHLRQNLYSAVWHTNIVYGDYDMWWSDKANPVESGVLRAISGGPVYVSDEVGTTNLENLLPVCGNDGNICRMEANAMPTKDCIFADCEKADTPLLKGFNYFGDAFALAVYNIYRDVETKTETFKFGVIPGLDAEKNYVAYEYFTKKFTLVNAESTETLTMANGEVKAYSIYPVEGEGDDAYIMLGDCGRYFGIATPGKVKTLVRDIVK